MGIRCVSALVGVVAVAVIGGCTTASPGRPAPATTVEDTTGSDSSTAPSTSGDRELPYAGAPKVDNPLDTARFQQDPCQALTQDQALSLGLSPSGAPREMPLGNACEWSTPGSTGRATVHFLDRSPYGLSAEYQAHRDGKTAFFTELPPVEGYPAVATDVADSRAQGACTVVVGVSDEVSFEVPITLAMDSIGSADPCETAATVAGLALRTMKQG